MTDESWDIFYVPVGWTSTKTSRIFPDMQNQGVFEF